jgi:GNAT superfamily N-acetyltransferase
MGEEIKHLSKYTECEQSIAALLFEGTEVVGAATGMPFHLDDEQIQKPLLDMLLDTNRYYHFAEALLLKSYRGRGAGHHFYDLRERHAKALGFEWACLYMKDRNEMDPEKPKDYFPLDDFWRKRGFVHHSELKLIRQWKKITEHSPTDQECSFWIKKL